MREGKSTDSDILNDYQISNIIEHFPSIIKTNDWELLYSLNSDGVSVGTFYERCKYWKLSLIVIKEKGGYIFGGFCTENWR